ncbi:MAG: hypothetical protein E7618_02810 [Ruminococcaceae bacterium]|nr:hypothetical protein [Oscillospiraceae bacterium]
MNPNFDPNHQNQTPNPDSSTNPNPTETTYAQQGEYQDPYAGQNPYAGQQPPYQNPYQGPYGQPPYYQQPYVDESGWFSEAKMSRLNGQSANIKLGDWLKSDCLFLLNFIPGIGSLVTLVVYCILAFSSKTAKSMKTRYQANLIWSGIMLVLSFLFIGFIIALAGSIVTEFGGEFGPEINNF